MIVVTDLTRLSRSQGDLSKMIDRLTMQGIRFIGVQDGYDSARRGHKLQAGSYLAEKSAWFQSPMAG